MKLPAANYFTKFQYCIGWITFFLSLIIIRLIYLQIIVSQNFFDLSVKNFLRTEPIYSLRGNILDCHGELLATNRPITTLYWQGTGNKNISEKQLHIVQALGTILHNDIDSLLSSIKHAEKNKTKVILASDITFEQLSKITEQFPDNPNIFLYTHYKRFYPYKTVASHILGHINKMNMDTIGKMGLEKILHQQLQGQQGELVKAINSVGSDIKQLQLKEALAGENISTTLDLSLQLLAESLFPENYAGTLLVMDSKNGAIKALVSRPNFDPTIFLDPIAVPDWQELQKEKPFLNRAFDTCYPPASTFKLITLSAALEHNIIEPNDTLFCRGFFYFKGRRYYCNKHAGHGELTVKEAVAKSCNILFYYIATKISVDLLAEYAARFGFGQKTNILFPEKKGLVPSTSWKLQEKGERWWQGETLSCAIGQSYLLATPIQIACMISSIFEGYLVTPRILEQEPIIYRPLELNEKTRAFLKKSMKLVIKIGNCTKLSTIKNMRLYAKTGTAQTCSLNTHDDHATLAHAWFVCYFQYQDQNPLVLVILLEHAGSSRLATTIAKDYLLNYQILQEKNIQKNKPL